MHALIVINGYTHNASLLKKASRLKEALFSKGVSSDILLSTSLLAISTGDENRVSLPARYDFCFYLDKDSYLCRALSLLMPVFNSYESLLLSDDKMLTLQALQGTGIKAPETIAAPLCYVDRPDRKAAEAFLDGVERRLSYPLVFKACHGSLGRQVRRIEDRKDLESCYYENCHLPHLYEAYLPFHPGRDYRLITIGERAVACMERVNERDFRSNIALGGKGFDVTDSLPDTYKEVALKAAKALLLDYAGIDIAIGKDGEPLFLEANGNAFFSEIEKVTGIDIASLLVDHVLRKLG